MADQFLDQHIDDVRQFDLRPGLRRREFSQPRRLARIERPDVEPGAQQFLVTDAAAGHVVPRDRSPGQGAGPHRGPDVIDNDGRHIHKHRKVTETLQQLQLHHDQHGGGFLPGLPAHEADFRGARRERSFQLRRARFSRRSTG